MANYLITGTSRGLGLAFVERLCASPPAKIGTIFATARTFSPALETIIAGSEGRVLFLTLDCTDKKSIDGAVEAVAHKLNGKGIDVLINNAGVQGTPASTEAMLV
jgi:NAD(P)-dependent dehydrogenase (short-subunit alcohol dehydrogenase family)